MRNYTSLVAIFIGGALCFASSGDAKTRVPARSFRDCAGSCPQMIVIPAGEFTMGASPGEEEREGLSKSIRGRSVPQHRVKVAAFAAGKYDVTRDEYAAFVSETHRSDRASCNVFDGAKFVDTSGRSWRNPGYSQTGRDPVVCVSAEDAQAYASWLSRKTGRQYRLLSESEWEYAARAGTATARYWGESAADQCVYANGADQTAMEQDASRPVAQCRDGYANTSPVGSFRPNAFGLYDMLGNVWQWTADCWNANYHGAPANGAVWTAGDCGQRVFRGGSWHGNSWVVRAAYRGLAKADSRLIYIGFRVARAL